MCVLLMHSSNTFLHDVECESDTVVLCEINLSMNLSLLAHSLPPSLSLPSPTSEERNIVAPL